MGAEAVRDDASSALVPLLISGPHHSHISSRGAVRSSKTMTEKTQPWIKAPLGRRHDAANLVTERGQKKRTRTAPPEIGAVGLSLGASHLFTPLHSPPGRTFSTEPR